MRRRSRQALYHAFHAGSLIRIIRVIVRHGPCFPLTASTVDVYTILNNADGPLSNAIPLPRDLITAEQIIVHGKHYFYLRLCSAILETWCRGQSPWFTESPATSQSVTSLLHQEDGDLRGSWSQGTGNECSSVDVPGSLGACLVLPQCTVFTPLLSYIELQGAMICPGFMMIVTSSGQG